MASVNKLILIGNLTRDPELRHTPKGVAVVDLGMALNRTYKKGDEVVEDVTFVDVTAWGKTAENCAKFLSKGSSLFVEGRLHMDTWADKESGKNRSKLKVVAEYVQFLGSGGSKQKPNNPPKSAPAKESPKFDPRFSDDEEDDDIPF